VIFSNSDKIRAIIGLEQFSGDNNLMFQCATALNDINRVLASYEKIHEFYIFNESFTIENGLLTSTLKIRRQAIIEKFQNEPFHNLYNLSVCSV
jgi:long-subunit acyl-CoA synthetase (AMP-forming)